MFSCVLCYLQRFHFLRVFIFYLFVLFLFFVCFWIWIRFKNHCISILLMIFQRMNFGGRKKLQFSFSFFNLFKQQINVKIESLNVCGNWEWIDAFQIGSIDPELRMQKLLFSIDLFSKQTWNVFSFLKLFSKPSWPYSFLSTTQYLISSFN